jgi:hypothetical protein
VVVGAGVCALAALWFMSWATKRSGAWALAAGVLAAFAALAGAVVIGWLMTRSFFGPIR